MAWQVCLQKWRSIGEVNFSFGVVVMRCFLKFFSQKYANIVWKRY